MLRNLLLLIGIIGATSAIAQEDKTTAKQPETKIDYKQPGSPMPKLLMINCIDSNRLGKDVASDPGQKPLSKRQREKELKKAAEHPYTTNEDVDNGANLLVMMFNPTCSHCEDETQMLEKNMSLFKNTKLVMIANKYMQPYLPNFVSSYHVKDYPAIYIGIDSTNFIDNIFLYSALPQIDIYDHNRKLIRAYTGEVAIDSLKKYIE